MQAQPPPLVAITIGLLLLAVVGVFVLWLFRIYERLALKALSRQYADLPLHETPQAGDVILVYHTYHGLLAWFTQSMHSVALPPADARRLLNRLLRFNCTWGLFTAGAVFGVPLAILNYIAQRRSIRTQEANGGLQPSWIRETNDRDERGNARNVDSSNLATIATPTIAIDPTPPIGSQLPAATWRPIVGWIAAALSGLFAISCVVCVLTRQFDAIAGTALMSIAFGGVARFLLKKRDR